MILISKEDTNNENVHKPIRVNWKNAMQRDEDKGDPTFDNKNENTNDVTQSNDNDDDYA